MAKGAATEEAMGLLHNDVAKALSSKVSEADCDPRYLGIAVKFLNDNKVSMLPEISKELGEIELALQRRQHRFKSKNITDIATKYAMASNE